MEGSEYGPNEAETGLSGESAGFLPGFTGERGVLSRVLPLILAKVSLWKNGNFAVNSRPRFKS
jgi:hypothetical protein